ncbi:MAG: hypothetical protein JO104_05245, partial [Candidatus Eremiobacteraeota bacterium]|nr:hypothetical protein [Candidatus Eremiobacteraeota bacterium]
MPSCVRRITIVCAFVTALAGCSSTGTPVPLDLSSGSGADSRHWLPAGGTGNLVYVLDEGARAVYRYSYATRKQTGKLKGPFYVPLGICLDEKQDVFVVDNSAQFIREYSHDGKTVVHTLDDFLGFPAACSVDPTTGNLAVTNAQNADGSYPGNVVIYPHVTGTPKEYGILNAYYVYFPAYDDKGNLFVNGYSTRAGASLLAELSKRDRSFRDLKIKT